MFCCFGFDVFLLSIASVAQAVAFNSSSADLFDILDRKCGRTWALQNCDVNGCPERNVTCESERDMAAFLVQVAKMSVFYSARRENKHLQNILNIACPNQGPGWCLSEISVLFSHLFLSAECASFVSARLAESSAWISANTPTIFDRAMFASPSFARELEKRQVCFACCVCVVCVNLKYIIRCVLCCVCVVCVD